MHRNNVVTKKGKQHKKNRNVAGLIEIKAEPFDSMQYLYRYVQIPQIRCSLHMQGHISVDMLKQAMNQMLQEFPILSCQFCGRKMGWRSGNWSIEDYLVTIPDSGKAVEEEKKALLYELNLEQEPPMKLFLINNSDQIIIVITVSHLLCDGRGFLTLLHRMKEQYQHVLLSGTHPDRYNKVRNNQIQAVLNNRSFDQITSSLGWKGILQVLRSKPLYSARQTQQSIFTESTERHVTATENHRVVLRRVLSSEEILLIKKYAHQRHATMNDLILAAYVCALHQLYGWNEITLPCPVDLRRYTAHSDLQICNLTGNYYCHVDWKIVVEEETSVQDGSTFAKVLQVVAEQMNSQKNRNDCLRGPILYHILSPMLPLSTLKNVFFKSSPVPVTSYTNLGEIIDKKDQSEAMFLPGVELVDAYLVTAIKHAPYYQMSVSSFNGAYSLTCCFQGDQDQRRQAEQLLDEVYKLIRNH